MATIEEERLLRMRYARELLHNTLAEIERTSDAMSRHAIMQWQVSKLLIMLNSIRPLML